MLRPSVRPSVMPTAFREFIGFLRSRAECTRPAAKSVTFLPQSVRHAMLRPRYHLPEEREGEREREREKEREREREREVHPNFWLFVRRGACRVVCKRVSSRNETAEVFLCGFTAPAADGSSLHKTCKHFPSQLGVGQFSISRTFSGGKLSRALPTWACPHRLRPLYFTHFTAPLKFRRPDVRLHTYSFLRPAVGNPPLNCARTERTDKPRTRGLNYVGSSLLDPFPSIQDEGSDQIVACDTCAGDIIVFSTSVDPSKIASFALLRRITVTVS